MGRIFLLSYVLFILVFYVIIKYISAENFIFIISTIGMEEK